MKQLSGGIRFSFLTRLQISSSRLITSYALPPQTSFTCPPTSLRIKISKTKVERRTYVSTTGTKPQITLFSEDSNRPSSSPSTTHHEVGSSKHPIAFMGIMTSNRRSDITESKDLLIVKEDGEIQCLDGTSLQEKWTSPASALYRDSMSPTTSATVEFAQLTNAHAASQGILKGRQDVFALFPQEISEDGFVPVVET